MVLGCCTLCEVALRLWRSACRLMAVWNDSLRLNSDHIFRCHWGDPPPHIPPISPHRDASHMEVVGFERGSLALVLEAPKPL